METISFVSQLMVKDKINIKCEGCGRAIQVTINDDCYIFLPDGSIRFKCPHCNQEHRIDLQIEKV